MTKSIACYVLVSLVFTACNIIQPQITNPIPNDSIAPTDTISPSDTILPTDTIVASDTIVPSDTIPIQPDTVTHIMHTADTIIIGTGDAPREFLCNSGNHGLDSAPGADACLTIVRFYNQEQANKVIVQHPIKRYNGVEGLFEYYENMNLYLNILPSGFPRDVACGLAVDLVNWADTEMHIAGTSPYVPLVDNYYLIDWKWHQLHPLSTIANSSANAYHNPLTEHICNHVFATDMDWQDLNGLTDRADAQSAQPIKGLEIIRVLPLELACYFNDVDSDPYVCWNMSIYYDNGMCLDNAYLYYAYGDCLDSGKSHLTYIAYCDSLQSVYQQRLIELIRNGQIKKVGY